MTSLRATGRRSGTFTSRYDRRPRTRGTGWDVPSRDHGRYRTDGRAAPAPAPQGHEDRPLARRAGALLAHPPAARRRRPRLASQLWDQIEAIPPGYIVAALIFQTGQTFFAGLSYYGILSAAYPGEVFLWPIVTAYAVGVAMNGFLPANIGTFVTLFMFVTIIPSCTFGGSIAAYLVQKIFFTIAGTFVYLYMFLSVPGAFDVSFGRETSHPGATLLVVVVSRSASSCWRGSSGGS